MKKKLILTILTVRCFLTVQAQQYTEVIYLKNGSIIRGTVIEQVPGESLKVLTSDGSTFVYRMDEVEKITKGQEDSKKKSARTRKPGGYIDLGYVQNVRRGEAGFSRIEVLSSYGYHANPYFYAGGGLGLNYVCGLNEFYMPLVADIKLSLPIGVGQTALFTDCKIGYAFGLGDAEECGGLYFTPSLGISIGSMYFSVGYVSQSIFWDFDSNLNEVNVSLRGVSVRLGFKL